MYSEVNLSSFPTTLAVHIFAVILLSVILSTRTNLRSIAYLSVHSFNELTDSLSCNVSKSFTAKTLPIRWVLSSEMLYLRL